MRRYRRIVVSLGLGLILITTVAADETRKPPPNRLSDEVMKLEKDNAQLSETVGKLHLQLEKARGRITELRNENRALKAKLERLRQEKTMALLREQLRKFVSVPDEQYRTLPPDAQPQQFDGMTFYLVPLKSR